MADFSIKLPVSLAGIALELAESACWILEGDKSLGGRREVRRGRSVGSTGAVVG